MMAYVRDPQHHADAFNGQCARTVAKYINAGIGNFDLHIPSGVARDFGAVLKQNAHFYVVPNGSHEPGDVAVLQGWKGVEAGHTAVWIEDQWASEILQSNFLAGKYPWFNPDLPYVSSAQPEYQVYRWPNPREEFNKLEISNQSPQEAMRRLAEFLDYCSYDPVAMEADFNRIRFEAGATKVRAPKF